MYVKDLLISRNPEDSPTPLPDICLPEIPHGTQKSKTRSRFKWESRKRKVEPYSYWGGGQKGRSPMKANVCASVEGGQPKVGWVKKREVRILSPTWSTPDLTVRGTLFMLPTRQPVARLVIF